MMKTRYFAIATAILALASCTQSEEFTGSGSAQNQTISFGQPFVGKTSRAASGDIQNTEDLKNYQVKVWGEKYTGDVYKEATDKEAVFTGEVLHWDAEAVTLDGTNQKGKWVYNSDQRVWDEKKNYDFVGFAPADASCQVSYTNGLMSITDVPLVQEIKNATTDGATKSGEDLLLSAVYTSKATATQRPLIEMNFKHILSRLSVYAYTTLGSGYAVSIDEMSLYMPKEDLKASYAQTEHNSADSKVLPAGAWTWSSDFSNMTDATSAADLADYQAYDIVNSSVNIYDGDDYTNQATNLNHNFFLVPAENVTLYVKVKYTIKGLKDNGDGTSTTYDSKQYEKFLPITALKTFKQGFQHNLYMLINPSSILFNVTGVEGWDTGKEDNNFVDGHGYSFNVSNLQNDETNQQVTGVIDNYGNLKVGESEEDIVYSLASVTGPNDFSATTPSIKILGWYSDAECTGTAATTPSLINRYAKFAWDYSKTTLSAGKYTFTFKNNMNDKAQTVDLDLTAHVYNPTSNGNGGLNGFDGVDM